MLVSFVSLNRVSDLFLSGRNVLKFPSIANSSSLGSQSPGLLLLHLQSTRARSISSQEQVQHQNAKNSQHRDQKLLSFYVCEQQCDNFWLHYNRQGRKAEDLRSRGDFFVFSCCLC